jgi:hypothetical protein
VTGKTGTKTAQLGSSLLDKQDASCRVPRSTQKSTALETVACTARPGALTRPVQMRHHMAQNRQHVAQPATSRKRHSCNEKQYRYRLGSQHFRDIHTVPACHVERCQRVGLCLWSHISYPSPPHSTTDHIHVRHAFGAVACLYATMKLHCVFGWEIAVCICERANLYRHLSKKPLPQTCKVRLAHRLHRA